MKVVVKQTIMFKGERLVIGRAKIPKEIHKVNEYIEGMTKIFVGGLPTSTKLSEFREHFSRCGVIKESSLPLADGVSGKNKGHGFITFEKPSAAKLAVENVEFHRIREKWVS